MRSKSEQSLAVMFADIAGSSAMYKAIGNSAAKSNVLAAIDKMSQVIRYHSGTLVKHIGDEVLCHFPSADLAALAASSIQLAFQQPLEGIPDAPMISVRIGIHWGPAILDNNDIFGDAVNTAARVVSAAKEKQIVITPETVAELDSFLKQRCRAFDLVKMKAFAKPVFLYIFSWEESKSSNATHVSTGIMKGQQASQPESVIGIHFQNNSLLFSSSEDAFIMGREQDIVHLWVNTRFASRRHAWIEFRRGKFVLFDHSTNGTYVRIGGDHELFLKREELPLRGSGSISLGQTVKDNEQHIIGFDCPD